MKNLNTFHIIAIILLISFGVHSDDTPTPSPVELLAKARASFALLAKDNSEFEPADVARVKTDQSWGDRFLLDAYDEDDVVQNMLRTLKWRKSYGVKNFTDDYFPQEIWKIGFLTNLGNYVK